MSLFNRPLAPIKQHLICTRTTGLLPLRNCRTQKQAHRFVLGGCSKCIMGKAQAMMEQISTLPYLLCANVNRKNQDRSNKTI